MSADFTYCRFDNRFSRPNYCWKYMSEKSFNTETETSSRVSSTVWTAGLFAVVTIWALLTGYYRMFSVFSGFDDEGYLMMSVKQFLNGDALYVEIWTLYGPAYYLYKWFVHGLLNLPITHDVTKFTTLLMWTLISLLGGLVARRLTGAAIGGAAVIESDCFARCRKTSSPTAKRTNL